jgi:hypothetical protein
MLRGLVISGAVGALLLVGSMTTGLLDLREELGSIRNPFDKASAALSEPLRQAHAWNALGKKADSICARYAREELVIRPTLPRRRADYVRAARSPWRSPVSARRPRSTRGDEWPSP